MIEDERLAAVVWGIVALSVLMGLNLVASRAGRAMRAIATSEATAAAAGVNVAMVKLRLFVLAAALAGLAGGLFTSYLLFLSPDAFPLIISITFVVMVAVGGMGSVYGAVVGAVAITYLEDKLRELGAREELLGFDLPAGAQVASRSGVFGADPDRRDAVHAPRRAAWAAAGAQVVESPRRNRRRRLTRGRQRRPLVVRLPPTSAVRPRQQLLEHPCLRELQEGAVIGRHRDDDVGPLDGHRRRAIRLEGSRQGLREDCLPVLHGGDTRLREALLVRGLRLLAPRVDARRRAQTPSP